jgi:hypothetical protein
MPGEDFHLSVDVRLQAHGLAPTALVRLGRFAPS